MIDKNMSNPPRKNTDKPARKNIYLSQELAKWYEEKAKEMGIAQSALIVTAMMQYKQQYEAMNMLPSLLKKLKEVGIEA